VALEQTCTVLIFATLATSNAVMGYTAVVTLKRVWVEYVNEAKKAKGMLVFQLTSRKTTW